MGAIRARARGRWRKLPTYVLLVITALAVVLPLLFVFINSFKGIDEFYANVFGMPRKLVLGNYPAAWKQGSFFTFLANSVEVTVVSVAVLVCFGTLASFPIARRRLFGASFIYIAFLSGLMIPAQVISIPLFIIERKLLLLDSLPGLILVYVATQLPITIFIFVGFMRGIPVELEEAALLDGCTDGGILRRVILPLLAPAVATVVILTALNIWNDFFYPLILVNTRARMTVTLGLFAFRSFFRVTFTELFAYMSSMLVPLLILYLALQKLFIKGITAGAVKG